MKYFILILTSIITNLVFSQSKSVKTVNEDGIKFESFYTYSLRGELNKVFEIINTFEEEQLSSKQLKIKKDLYKRFVTKTEDYDYNCEDSVIINMINKFQDYWRSVMIENVDQELADSLFINEMIAFLQKEFKPDLSTEEIEKNYYTLSQDFFKSKGLFGNAMGKTGHLFDLYLWKDEREKVYEISLPEKQVKVPVVFMRNFISIGWAHYTTFGHAYTGGWAKPGKLFCVEQSYDLSSENFKISYISHEGQHFADYKTFPKLKQTDLEYRAKLTELSLAKESVMDVISKFLRRAKNDKGRAHAFANYSVIKNLSLELFDIEYQGDVGKWERISVKKINKASVKLLKEHTSKLNEKGATTVETYIL